MSDTLQQPTVVTFAMRKAYLQSQVQRLLDENPGRMYSNPRETYIYIGVRKEARRHLNKQEFTHLVEKFFNTEKPLTIKDRNKNLGVSIGFNNIVVPKSFVDEHSKSVSLVPVVSQKVVQPKASYDEKESVVKQFARLGLALSIDGEHLIPTHDFQQHLFLLAQKENFQVKGSLFQRKVVLDILQRGSFLDDLFLAKSLLEKAGISFKKFEENICTVNEDSKYKNGRSFPVEFSSHARSQEALDFLRKFFTVNRCDETRLFLVNRVPIFKILGFLKEEFRLSDKVQEGTPCYQHNSSKDELIIFGFEIETVVSRLEEVFPHVSFSVSNNKLVYRLITTKGDNSAPGSKKITKQKSKAEEMEKSEKPYLALNKTLVELGIKSTPQEEDGVYYVGAPKTFSISICNATPEVMSKIEEKFTELHGDTFAFDFKEKSVHYTLRDSSNSESVEATSEKKSSEEELRNFHAYQAILALLPLLSEEGRQALAGELGANKLTREEVIAAAKEYEDLLIIEGGKIV